MKQVAADGMDEPMTASPAERILTTAIIGVGHWGANVLRVLAGNPRSRLKYICDLDTVTLQQQAAYYAGPAATPSFSTVLSDPAVQAVFIATEAPRHFELASAALAAGKHVFVEKPMTLNSRDARTLIDKAAAAQRKLMVGHLLEYHPAFDSIRDLIEAGHIGDIHYMYTQRLNLGIVRKDENAWWSLAPHDISVICRLFNAEPVSVAASGQCYLQRGVEDVVFATLKFADGRMASIHVSWLDPHKIRQMTLVGTRKMITWDDMAPGEPVRIYDKSAVTPRIASYAESITLRSGDIVIPRIPAGEPLVREIGHFVDACLNDLPVTTDGVSGLRVVRVLEAGARSLAQGGAPFDVHDVDGARS